MQNVKKINPRPNISREVADRLRHMIVTGSFFPGQRINEVHLAAELGVSRTPLREALTTLVSEGALETIPRRGFFVKPLTIEELKDIYPIRAILDPAALKMAGIPAPRTLKDLEIIKDRMAAAKKVDQIIDLDNDFHLKLLEHCPNTSLIELIRQFMARTRRYEIGLMSSQSRVQTAVGNKEKIISLLREEKLDEACAALKATMERGLEPIIQWLKEEHDKERGE